MTLDANEGCAGFVLVDGDNLDRCALADDLRSVGDVQMRNVETALREQDGRGGEARPCSISTSSPASL